LKFDCPKSSPDNVLDLGNILSEYDLQPPQVANSFALKNSANLCVNSFTLRLKMCNVRFKKPSREVAPQKFPIFGASNQTSS
jgi:hypothetical protein